MHSLGIVQWNSTRRDHPGNPGGVSGSGPVRVHSLFDSFQPALELFGRSGSLLVYIFLFIF